MQRKLKILGELGVFEVSDYIYQKERFSSFIYPSICNGKIVKLFKVLLTNKCKFNCLYCANRRDRDCPRYSFTPKELADIFYNMWKKNFVDGLFLSSGIDEDQNETESKMIEVVEILRKKYEYKGYIHLKILPGVDEYLIKRASLFSDRLSLNMESVAPFYLKRISKEKDFFKNLLNTLKKLSEINRENPLKSGISTQIIVGASDERDKEILNFVYYLYKNYGITKTYFSAFIPVPNTPFENRNKCSFKRQAFLYKADILLIKYGFLPSDIPFDENGNLYLEKDPKYLWAEKNNSFFPVEINKDDFYQLIRVPGIGIRSAKKIIEIRKYCKINSPEILKKIGVRLNKALPFILLNGKKIKEKIVEESLF